ncbi:MAG: hypothetical protein H8E44_33905 [Planctomycetes bacterium]|nr:hypothetical protein [Planctomycetota bacterium]
MSISLWNLQTGEVTERIALAELASQDVRLLAKQFSADGARLATCSHGSVRVWDLMKQQTIFTRPWNAERGNRMRPPTVLLSPDGRFLAVAPWGSSDSGDAELWKVDTGEAVVDLPGEPLAFSGDGKSLACFKRLFGPGEPKLRIAMWDIEQNSLSTEYDIPYEEHVSSVNDKQAVLSADGGYLAIWGRRDIDVWHVNPEKVALECAFKAHTDQIVWLCFSPDGSRLASCARDGTVKIWSLGRDVTSALNEYINSTDSITAVSLARTGGARIPMVATLDTDSRKLKLWGLDSGESKTIQLWEGADVPQIVSVSHDGQSLAVQMRDGEVGFATFENEGWLRTSISFGSIALSPEGHHVFIGGEHCRPPVVSIDGRFVVTDYEPLAVWTPSSATDEKDVSATEVWERGGEGSGSLALWDISRQEFREGIVPLPGRLSDSRIVSLNQDRLAVYLPRENEVHFADMVRNASWGLSLKGQGGGLGSTCPGAFAPDLQRLATPGERNSRIAIFDLRSGDLLAALSAGGHISEIGFGKRLVAAIINPGGGQRVQAWEAASEDDVLADLHGAVDLRQFGLDELRLVMAKQLWQLQDFASLRTLDFSNMPVTDELLSTLRGLERLEVLVLSRTQITDAGLERLDELPNLNTLDLSHTNVTDAGLEDLKAIQGLTSLDLRGTNVTDDGLEHLKTLKNLNSLRLSDHVTRAAVMELWQHLPYFRDHLSRLKGWNLPESRLSQTHSSFREDESMLEFLAPAITSRDAIDNVVELGGREFTDAELRHVRDLPLLRSLHVRGHVTDGGLAPLSELLHLERLSISRSLVTGPGLRHLVDLPELAELSLYGHSITDKTLANVARLRHLGKLTLRDTCIKRDGLKHLQELDKLTELHISRHTPNPRDQLPIDHLLPLTQLERLGLAQTKLTPGSFGELLRNLTNLNSVTINLSTECLLELKQASEIREVRLVIHRDEFKVVDGRVVSGLAPDATVFAHIADLAHLERLYFGVSYNGFFGNDAIGSAEFDHIAKLKRLKSLGLRRTSTGDDDLVELQGFARLEELNLADTSVGDAGVVHLTKLPGLREIDLGNTRIGDSSVAALAELTELRHLNLRGTQITDAGVKQLAQLSKLEHLDLSGTKITDDGLQHLEHLTKLQRLDSDAKPTGPITLEGIRSLRQALPDCVITPWVPRDDDSNGDPTIRTKSESGKRGHAGSGVGKPIGNSKDEAPLSPEVEADEIGVLLPN